MRGANAVSEGYLVRARQLLAYMAHVRSGSITSLSQPCISHVPPKPDITCKMEPPARQKRSTYREGLGRTDDVRQHGASAGEQTALAL